MNRLILPVALALTFAGAGCDTPVNFTPDLGPDLALPPQVTHVGVTDVVCCIETTSTAPRVMYISKPRPGGSDINGNDIATKGELHIADAYGTDILLAASGSTSLGVPRNSYAFTPDGRFIFYLVPATKPADGTFALEVAALSTGTLGVINPVTVVPRGLDDVPLSQQSFFSTSGRYLVFGVKEPGIMNSSDLTVVDIENAKQIFQLANGSFDYLEAVTSTDIMVYENSVASKTPGIPSVEGLYSIPLSAAASGVSPSLIDTHTVTYAVTPNEQRVLYTKQDSSLWLYDFLHESRLQIASNVVVFTMGSSTSSGPLVYIKDDFSLHVTNLLQPELVATAPGTVDPWASFIFSPDGSLLYYFAKTSSLNTTGDMYRLDLRPGHVSPTPLLIDRDVSQGDVTFVSGRMRYIRNVDGRGDVGELVSTELDGTGVKIIAEGVALASVTQANPQTVLPVTGGGNPPRGPEDMSTPILPPVWAQIINASRDATLTTSALFDSSEAVVGSLAFGRQDDVPTVLNTAVHVGSFRFSSDGYILAYAGNTKVDTTLKAYLGSIALFQTLIDRGPVIPTLDGVSEIGVILDRGFFAAAPGASPAGVYFVRY